MKSQKGYVYDANFSNQDHKYDHFDVIILVRHKKPW